jgi:tetratricopeptide (TPR) repeat protein
MARADRRRATRQGRSHREVGTTGQARVAAEQDMFFPKLRKQAKWMFVFLALVFGLGFVLFGVGSGSGGLTDLFQGDLFGSSDPAEKDAENARDRIAKNPNDAEAYRLLATASQTRGERDDAITALQKYRTLRPKDMDAASELAALYLQRAEAARARGNAIQAQAGPSLQSTLFGIDPTTELGKAFGATAYGQTATDPTATPENNVDPVNKAVQLDVNSRSNVEYDQMQSAYDQAVVIYQEVANASPRDPNAWSQLASAAEAAGDVPKVIAAYEQFIKLAPDDPAAAGVKARLAQLRRTQPSGNVGG